MSKALVIVKSMGIGDLVILIANIHAISKWIKKPVVVLAPKNTHASSILKYDPHIEEVIDMEKKGFFNIVKKIKDKKFDQSYIFSDSIRFYLISKIAGVKENFQYDFFSKKGKNFFKTAKEFTEKILKRKIDSASKIYWDKQSIEKAKKDYGIKNNVKNIVCGISASGPTKRWDVDNYIKLFQQINSKFTSNFFLFGGKNDEILIEKITSSVENCISLSKLDIEQIIPIIASCPYYIGGDTGAAHLSANLGSKCLILFCDSPPSAYGLWNQNIKIIVPSGETIESCGHNTRGKDKISFDEVLKKSLDLIS